ncbi:MAG: hypothetical protein CVV27_20800, partial [Candidatus Melainabacteria bacterium HGW-Melainabacteria-1]
RNLLAQQGIPEASRSYYVRWLNMYLDACLQNHWEAGNSTYIESFIDSVSAKHPSAFLQQQARQAIWLFQQLTTAKDASNMGTNYSQAQESMASPQTLKVKWSPYQSQSAAQVEQLSSTNRKHLDAIAQRIKNRQQCSVEDIIGIGRDLNQAKRLLPHGQFTDWLTREFDLGYHTANRLMHVAEQLGDKVSTVLTLSKRALYELASPSTTSEIRHQILQQLEAGNTIRFEDIKILKQGKPSSDLDVRPSPTPFGNSLRSLNRKLSHWLDQTELDLASDTGELDPLGQTHLAELEQHLTQLQNLVQKLNQRKTINMDQGI